MIRIFYNPQELGLIYTIASLILAKSHDEYVFFLPVATKNLLQYGTENLDLSQMTLSNESETNAVLFEILEEEDDKIILLNIYPKNDQEKIVITNFYDQYEKKIMLWLDNHTWDEELLRYLGNNPRIFIKPGYTCGQLLILAGYLMPTFWAEAEIALINNDPANDLSNRYLRAWMVEKVVSLNLTRSTVLLADLFADIVCELVQAEENYEISELSELFYEMVREIKWAKRNFSTENPIFYQAKKMGRTVGYLALDDVNDYFDVSSIVNLGTNKFPWLCVVEFSLNGRSQLAFGSKKLPIHEILKGYENVDTPLNNYLLMQLVNAELIKL